MNNVFLFEGDIMYPAPEDNYNPYCNYPEYPWPNELSRKKNDVYEAVRETLFGIGLDKKNFGTANWNPFGEIITPGDSVLIKPNWVLHKNNNSQAGLDCLVTHTSIIRVVTDYCIIALNGKGKIIVGDAPIQGADLKVLFTKNHLNELFKFYQDKNIEIEFCDFRLYQTVGSNGVWHKRIDINDKEESINVDLTKNSEFYSINHDKRKYHVMDYNSEKTKKYHKNDQHIYSINKVVLNADVIINLPKPKCHKLAGITGALKNMVGIVADKACLPHDSLGSKHSGGDSFPDKNLFKTTSVAIRELKTRYEDKGYFIPALFTRYLDSAVRLLIKGFTKNQFEFGSWHGNDTIWRTILDLETIIKFADKRGVVQKEIQRKQFHIADMVIAGELDGPLSPSAKKLGVIVAGFNASITDYVITRIMGFDERKIPSIFNSLKKSEFSKNYELVEIGSNKSFFSGKKIGELELPEKMAFKPHAGWKGFIERQK